MAGFLAPTISDIGASPVAPSPPADTSVGSALSGIAGIINLVGRSGSKTTETQQDRDDRVLRPIFNDFRKLLAQRDSGRLSPSAFKTKWTVLMSGAIAANPSQRDTIVDGFSVLAGEPIGAVEQTIEGTQRDARNLFLGTPEGQVLLARAVSESLDDDGNLISREALELAVDKLYGEDLLRRAKAAQDTEEVRVAKETNEFNNIKQARWIDPLLSEQSQMAAEVIKANISVFMKTLGSSSDAVTAVAGLAGVKAQLLSNFTADAASRGILDESSYTAGLALIAKQFDDQTAFLELIAGSEKAQLAISQTRNTKAVIDVINKAGVIASDPVIQLFAVLQLENNLTALTSAALEPVNINSEVLAVTASDPETPSVYTDAFTVEAANLDEELQIQDVTIGLARWKGGQNFSPEALKDEDQRLGLVTGLGRSLGVMNVTANPVGESTFDRVYDPAFINLYRSITKFDDETARTLENVVQTHLGITLDKRRTFTETNIRNRLGSDFPGVAMKWNGDKFIIDYGSGRGKTVPQTLLFDLFDKFSLPHTSEGVTVLIEGTQELSRDEIRNLRVVQRVESDEIAYLNKIIGTINMFPEFSETTLPTLSLEETITEHVIVTPEDAEVLQKGDAWVWTDADGIVHRGIK